MFEWFAGLDPQVQSGWIAGLTASLSTGLTVWLTQRYASKNLKETLEAEKAKHEAQLAEQRADRLFEARREVASRCLTANQHYKANWSDNEREATRQLRAILNENAGEVAMLFSTELNEVMGNVRGTLSFIWHAMKNQEMNGKTISRLSAKKGLTEEEREEFNWLTYLSEKNREAIKSYTTTLWEEFNILTEAFREELGTYEEQPAIEEA